MANGFIKRKSNAEEDNFIIEPHRGSDFMMGIFITINKTFKKFIFQSLCITL